MFHIPIEKTCFDMYKIIWSVKCYRQSSERIEEKIKVVESYLYYKCHKTYE